MAREFVQFRWFVHETGHEWVKTVAQIRVEHAEEYPDGQLDFTNPAPVPPGEDCVDWFLTYQAPETANPAPYRTYEPLADHPALFREFAGTEVSRNAILAFANRWGLLGGNCVELIDTSQHVPFRPARLDIQGRTTQRIGVRFRTWASEIARMRNTIELWDFVRTGDEENLASRIRWDGPNTVVFHAPEIQTFRLTDPLSEITDTEHVVSDPLTGLTNYRDAAYTIASDRCYPDRLRKFSRGEVLGPARDCVQDFVNLSLKARVSPRLEESAPATRPQIRLVPHGLIGALWLQLAQSIDGDRDYRRCSECLTWFEIAPGSGREDKRYCSNACRMRAYRKRKAAGKSSAISTVS